MFCHTARNFKHQIKCFLLLYIINKPVGWFNIYTHTIILFYLLATCHRPSMLMYLFFRDIGQSWCISISSGKNFWPTGLMNVGNFLSQRANSKKRVVELYIERVFPICFRCFAWEWRLNVMLMTWLMGWLMTLQIAAIFKEFFFLIPRVTNWIFHLIYNSVNSALRFLLSCLLQISYLLYRWLDKGLVDYKHHLVEEINRCRLSLRSQYSKLKK